jgi:hypothetical protein
MVTNLNYFITKYLYQDINGQYSPARNGQGHKFLQIIKVNDLNIFYVKLSATWLQLLSVRGTEKPSY